MIHPYIIDTALSRELLSEQIHQGHRGNCSVQGSMAYMKFVKHRVSKSVYYRNAVVGDFYIFKEPKDHKKIKCGAEDCRERVVDQISEDTLSYSLNIAHKRLLIPSLSGSKEKNKKCV